MWLLHNKGFDEVMADLRALNPLFMVFAPKILAGFTTRLKSEQATMRKLVIRMDTMRRTSYVSAGYLIAEITASVILVLLLITEIGQLAPTVLVVGVISYLLVYVLALIRDLDNPFEYPEWHARCSGRESRGARTHRGSATWLAHDDGCFGLAKRPNTARTVPTMARWCR